MRHAWVGLCAAALCAGASMGCRSAPATASTAAASGQSPSADATPQPGPTPDADQPDASSPAGEGEPCLGADDCESGVCEGEGCGDDTPGTCAATDRMCTRDARQYCGCDGETFVGSGSCPGRRFASGGPCEGDAGLGAAAPATR